MSIISGFKKYKNYKTDSNGDHQLQSFWTSSDSVDGNITEASTRANLVNGETLTTSLGKIKKFFSDLGTSAFKNTTDTYSGTGTDPVTGKAVKEAIDGLDVTGASNIAASKTIKAWSETDGKVSITTQDIAISNSQISGLGTASTKDAPATGVDATSTQVVMGDDSRLTDARPSSDVTDTYSSSGTVPVSGKAVASAIGDLDVTGDNNISAGKTIKSWSETDGKVSLTTQNIAIANTQVSGLGTASTKDVASSGDASTSQVVMGNDSRLTNARPASDVSAWAKASTKPTYTASEVGAIATTAKGANNGVAELDSTGKVPSNQLPSFVDDVLEYDSLSDFPTTGESGKIYIAKDTNITYRWGGTTYVPIGSDLTLGETSTTAYRGDRGKAAYDHSQITSGNPHNVSKSDVGLGNVGNFKAVSTVASQGLTDTEKANESKDKKPTLGTAAAKDVPSSGNASTSQVVLGSDTRLSDSRNAADVYSWAKASTKPTYTASEVGLGNVGNYKAVSTVANQGLTDTEKSNSRANIGAGTSNFSGAYADLSGKPTIPSKTSQLTNDSGYVTTDTKNTAGSTDTSSKIFLVGATSQAANPQTYSHDTAYVGTDGCLYSGGTKVLTSHQDISGKADKSATVSTVTWDSTNKKLTKTINGSTTDVVTGATILGGLTKAQVTTALGYTPPTSDTNTTYTFAGGTNKFTVTPSGGTAQDVTITPSIANNVTGSGTSGYLAKFNGANTVTSGPQLGSGTTTYLRNDGSWATPTDTKNTAGSVHASSVKLYLIGAASQADNPRTYSNSHIFISSGGPLNSESGLQIGKQKNADGYIGFYTSQTNYMIDLYPSNITTNRLQYLPDASGTLPVATQTTLANYPSSPNADTIYFISDADTLGYPVQDNASATDLSNGYLPTGQTIKSYLNSNFIRYSNTEVTASSAGRVNIDIKWDFADCPIYGFVKTVVGSNSISFPIWFMRTWPTGAYAVQGYASLPTQGFGASCSIYITNQSASGGAQMVRIDQVFVNGTEYTSTSTLSIYKNK